MRTKAKLIAVLIVALSFLTLGITLSGCSRQADEHRVTFIFHNDEDNLVMLVQNGSTIRKPVDPLRQGFNFMGWRTNVNDPATEWDFATDVVTGNVTLHAEWVSSHLTILQSSLHGKSVEEIYDPVNQALVRQELDSLRNTRTFAGQGAVGPLLVHNPFGTNPIGLYAAFNTPMATAIIRYTVIIDGLPDFVGYSGSEQTHQHEFMVLGFVSGMRATLLMQAINASGGVSFSREFPGIVLEYEGAIANMEVALETGKQYSDLSSGLMFALFGNNGGMAGNINIFDNHGINRGVLTSGFSAHGFEIDQDDNFVFGVLSGSIARVSRVGEVIGVYSATGYSFSHTFALGAENEILAAATRFNPQDPQQRDIVLRISRDSTTGALQHDELINLRDFFPLFPFDTMVMPNWAHINHLELVPATNGTYGLVISARHINSVIKVNDIYGTPSIAWIMTEDPVIRLHTQYTFLNKIDNPETGMRPRPTLGQHTATILPATSGHYLTLFNNFNDPEFVAPNTAPYDFTPFNLDLTGMNEVSFVEVWFIQQGTGDTWLVTSAEMPHAPFMSGVHNLRDGIYQGDSSNLIGTSNGGRIIQEFNSSGDLIATFSHPNSFFRAVRIFW